MVQARLHDDRRWPEQRAALLALRSGDVRSAFELSRQMSRTSFGMFPASEFAGVNVLEREDDEWWEETLPFVAALALASESLFPATGSPLVYLLPSTPATVSLTRLQCASVLALAFFDAIPPPPFPRGEMPDHLSFRHWLMGGDAYDADEQKARCLVHYFRAIRAAYPEMVSPSGGRRESRKRGRADRAAAEGGPRGSGGEVRFTRLVLDGAAQRRLTPESWRACSSRLLPLRVVGSGGIEGASGALHADFANEFIGGGVLCGGNVQEEIRFSVSPECLVSLLITPRMRPHEAVLIRGAKQYAAYTGYGGSFECAGAHDDGTGDEGSHIVALDATYYPGAEGAGQFAEAHMCRELVKLTAALADDGGEFAQPVPKGGRKGKWGRGAADEGAGAATRRHPSRGRPFATGNWGCGIFGGDPPLKALLQWMAASRCGRQLIYYPFGDARVAGLAEAAEAAIRAEATVGQLAAALFDATPDELMGRDAVGGGAFDVVRAALSS